MEEDPDQIIQDIARRIVELREERGLMQKDLAERLGMSPQHLHRIEQGTQNLTVRTMVKLAAALGVRTAELFEAPGQKRRRPPKAGP